MESEGGRATLRVTLSQMFWSLQGYRGPRPQGNVCIWSHFEQEVLSHIPSSRKACLIPFAPSLPSSFVSLFSVCFLLGFVPVEEHLESKYQSQLPPQSRLLHSLGVPSLPLNDQLVPPETWATCLPMSLPSEVLSIRSKAAVTAEALTLHCLSVCSSTGCEELLKDVLSVESVGTPPCAPEIPDCVEQVRGGGLRPLLSQEEPGHLLRPT